MSATLQRQRCSLAQMLATFVGDDPARLFLQAWKAKAFTVYGRRGTPTASIEEIPTAAAPYASPDVRAEMLIVRTGHGQRPQLTGSQLHTVETLFDHLLGPAERWYDVQISSAFIRPRVASCQAAPTRQPTGSRIDAATLPKALQSIDIAVRGLWQGVIPGMLRGGQRDQQIIDYLKSHPELSSASGSSIKRYMKIYRRHGACVHENPTDLV